MKCNATVVDHKSTATGRIDDWRPEIANYNKGRQESPRGLRFGFEKLRIGEAVREDIPFFGLLGFVFGVGQFGDIQELPREFVHFADVGRAWCGRQPSGSGAFVFEGLQEVVLFREELGESCVWLPVARILAGL